MHKNQLFLDSRMEKKFIFVLFFQSSNIRFSVRICRNLIFEVISTVSNRKSGDIVKSVKIMSNPIAHNIFQEIELSIEFLKENSLICEISA